MGVLGFGPAVLAARMSGLSTIEISRGFALSSRPDTRQEGVRWLRYAFGDDASYLPPLTYLALGRAWEAEGQRDSAAYAY